MSTWIHINTDGLTLQEYADTLVSWEEACYPIPRERLLAYIGGGFTSDDVMEWEINTHIALMEEV